MDIELLSMLEILWNRNPDLTFAELVDWVLERTDKLPVSLGDTSDEHVKRAIKEMVRVAPIRTGAGETWSPSER